MFDEEWWPPEGDLLAPPLESEWRPWDTADDDASWVDELAAGDPYRPRSVAELLHAAEHGPVEQMPLARLAQLDPASLSDTEQIALAVAAQRLENHAVGVRMRAAAAFAGPDPADDRGEAAFAWTDISGALHLGE